MKYLTYFIAITFCVFATAASAMSIEDAIRQKSGAWDTLKVDRHRQQIFDAALPIGNGLLSAKIFGVPNDETIPLNDTRLWSGTGQEHFEIPYSKLSWIIRRPC
jgi:hypothetical protein